MKVGALSLAKLSKLVRVHLLLLLFFSFTAEAIELKSLDGSTVNLERYILDSTHIKNAAQVEK